MRYIDADEIPYTDLSEGHGFCWVTFMDWIKKMPTADVVEVVRCRNCKHNYRRTTFNHGERDNPGCKYIKYVRDNDFYCKLGERADK